jgi:uncharacterized membrane protein
MLADDSRSSEMDPMEHVSDRSIRRALGFAGLGIGLVMVALSFDLPLALRCGAALAALVAVTLFIVAWRTPHRDLRHSEPWLMLNDMVPEFVSGFGKAELMRRLKETLRRRLIWHAERIGVLALALWAIMLALLAFRAL